MMLYHTVTMDWFRHFKVLLMMGYFMVIDVRLYMSYFVVNNVRLDMRLGMMFLMVMLMVLRDRCENKWLINDLIWSMMEVML